MLAKGHDYPGLTLVGVVDADAGLFSTDFRAAERLFALLTQVAGRAGRAGLPGEVLIQTDVPGHPLYAAVAAHDYAAFADSLLAERRSVGWPPYAHLAILRAEARHAATALAFLKDAARWARTPASPVEVFDPVAAPLARRAGLERMQLLVRARSRGALQSFLNGWRAMLEERANRRVRWAIDVDPAEA
jgi:primosomal protein N' (replication factor Y)